MELLNFARRYFIDFPEPFLFLPHEMFFNVHFQCFYTTTAIFQSKLSLRIISVVVYLSASMASIVMCILEGHPCTHLSGFTYSFIVPLQSWTEQRKEKNPTHSNKETALQNRIHM